ncbi:MAG: hypothetical protein WC462_01700 [archaeon]
MGVKTINAGAAIKARAERFKKNRVLVAKELSGASASEYALRKRTAELIKEMRKAKIPVSSENLSLISKAVSSEVSDEAIYRTSASVTGPHSWGGAARKIIEELKLMRKF